jgi:hypothetical protein
MVLSGRDSSVLALLAQSSSLPEQDKVRMLNSLQGKALEIGSFLIGREDQPSTEVRKAAEGLKNWAKQLR